MPAGQITGGDPSSAHLLPAGHIVHMELPGLVEYMRLIQGVHSVALVNEKVPAGQMTGTDPPGTHLLPAGHGDAADNPDVGHRFPGGHGIGADNMETGQ